MQTCAFFPARKLTALILVVAASARLASVAGEVRLEDNGLLAGFDTDSGALTRLEDKSTHWSIERRPELGASFRLLVPLPGRRDNFVLGRNQRALEVRKVSEHQIRIRWQDLASEHGGVLPITLRATVTLTYGQKIDALRRRYKAYLWDAEFRDSLGARVKANGSNRYSVFLTAAGKRAVVLVNPESDREITATVDVPNAGQLVVATPEQPEAQPTTGTVRIPARSAAVVMEL
jgi:hypothetical protein